jgi:hypothetical protein
MKEGNYAVLPSTSRYSGSGGVVVILTGAVAQLGARLHGMEEVEGSNPFGSTTLLLRKFQARIARQGLNLRPAHGLL